MDVGRVTEEPSPRPSPDADSEALIRRWLGMVIERSSLEELAERPLGHRIQDARTLLEAMGAEAPPSPIAVRRGGLRDEIDAQLERHRRTGEPFAVALIAAEREVPGLDHSAEGDEAEASTGRFRRKGGEAAGGPSSERWMETLERTSGERELVLPAGHGATAVVLPGATVESARAIVDRLRVAAWRLLDEEGPLADAGVAACPDDGQAAHELLAVAEERLDQASGRLGEPQQQQPAEPPREPEGGSSLRVLRLR